MRFDVDKTSNRGTSIGTLQFTRDGLSGFSTVSPLPPPNVTVVGDSRFIISGRTLKLAQDKAFNRQSGEFPIYLRATNFEGLFCQPPIDGCPTKRVTIHLINHPPTIGNSNNIAKSAEIVKDVRIGGEDIDGDDLKYQNLIYVDLPQIIGTVSSDGKFDYTSPAKVDASFEENMSVEVDDGSGFIALTFKIKADSQGNSPPVANNGSFDVMEGVPIVGDMPAIDIDKLIYAFPVMPAHGNITVGIDGKFTYTPTSNSNSILVDVFAYTATDTFNASATGILTFTITPRNDKPVITTPRPKLAVDQALNVSGIIDKDLNDAFLVTDTDTPKTDLRFRIIGSNPEDISRNGTLTMDEFGKLHYVARVNWAGEFQLFVGITDLPGDISANHESVGAIEFVVTLNGKGGHGLSNGADLSVVAGSLFARYKPFFPQGSEDPKSCHSCHQPGNVTVRAPDCNTTFFTEFGAKLCQVRPFDPKFGERLDEIADAFEPNATSAQQEPIEIAEEAAVGANVGKPLVFDAGSALDLKPTHIVDTIVEPANLAAFFNADTSGQIRIKKSLVGISNPVVLLRVLPVNDAHQKDNSGNDDPARKGGFYPVKNPTTITIFIRRQLPVVADDSYQTNNDPNNPLELDVLANDVLGGTATILTDVSTPTKGTVKIMGKKLFYTSDGVQTGIDTFTYRAEREGVGVSANTATVTIEIFNITAAVAQPDGPYLATLGTTATFAVLDNDRGPRPFASFAILPEPKTTHGVAKFVGDIIEYTPTVVGTDIFKYQVTGSDGVPTKATVTVNVSDISGDALAKGTNNPELKSVAFAMGDSCKQLEGAKGPRTADQNDLVALCSALIKDAGLVGIIDGALDAIRNEEVLAAGDAALQHDRATQGNILGRLDSSRGGGGRGLNLSQFTLQIDDSSLSGSLVDSTLEQAGFDGTILGNDNNPWGIFVAGTLSVATQSSSTRRAGFDLDGIDFTVGVDYAFDDKTLLGVAGSFGQSNVDFSSGGEMSNFSTQMAAYGSFELIDGLMLDGYGGYAFTNYEITRVISFTSPTLGPIDRIATGKFGGDQISAALRMKYTGSLEGFDVGTYGMLSYLSVWNDPFTETGAEGLSLAVGQQHFNTLAGTLGVRVSRKFTIEFAEITPFIGGSYARQFLSGNREVTSQFAAASLGGTAFSVNTKGEGQNFGSFELGFDAETEDLSKLSVGLSGTYSDRGFVGYTVKAGLQIPF